jgi:uncharacterized protein (DUF983 family)
MKLTDYPKNGISFDQIEDEEKLEAYRIKHGVKQVCPVCGNNEFFIDTLGIEHCSKCYHPMDL